MKTQAIGVTCLTGKSLLEFWLDSGVTGTGHIGFPSGRPVSGGEDRPSSFVLTLSWRIFRQPNRGPLGDHAVGTLLSPFGSRQPLTIRERACHVSITNSGRTEERADHQGTHCCCTEMVRALGEGRRLVLFREPDGPFAGQYSLPLTFEDENGGDTIISTSILRLRPGSDEADLFRYLLWDSSQ